MQVGLSETLCGISEKFFIDGAWIMPDERTTRAIISPANETELTRISMGSSRHVQAAVASAKKAFPAWATQPLSTRVDLLRRLMDIYIASHEEIAFTISQELGAPIDLARGAQYQTGLTHFTSFISLLEQFDFSEDIGSTDHPEYLFYEPIGVCGFITPWNWPMNQMMAKVVPALGVGCTVVMKPPELAPLSAMLVAEMIRKAGFPPGTFNLVNGDGPTVGEAICAHEDVAMISFTGSTRAGIAVTQAAAATIKRVVLELGGKSPNIIFADTDLESTVTSGAVACFRNSGQSCNAPTRMLVERCAYSQAVKIAADVAAQMAVDLPHRSGDHIGPLASAAQLERVRSSIRTGVSEGAKLVAGGPDMPEGFDHGFFVRPTVFSDVHNDMQIAQQEIFGPVLSIIPFDTEEDAILIANDTPYGLNAMVQSSDRSRAFRVAQALQAGMVQVNGARRGPRAPFGGYKQSGNGREFGSFGLKEFLEVKVVSG